MKGGSRLGARVGRDKAARDHGDFLGRLALAAVSTLGPVVVSQPDWDGTCATENTLPLLLRPKKRDEEPAENRQNSSPPDRRM